MSWLPRTRLIAMLDAIGALELAMAARRVVRLPSLPIVTYHRIGVPGITAHDLDEAVVDATKEDFERQIGFLMRHFTLLGIEDLRRHFLEQRPLPARPALITFDDGYRECHDVALPILTRVGAKAIFFVVTDPISDRTVFWWDRVNYLVKRSAKRRIEIGYPADRVFDLTADRSTVTAQMLDVIKGTPALDVERYLQALSAALDVPWHPDLERRLADDALMTWDHVRALRRAGMDVQSHTRTHRVLQMLRTDERDEELSGSRRILEDRLQEPVRAIAYPVTLTRGQRGQMFDAVRCAGYELGFSTSRGSGPLGRWQNPLDIGRIWVDSSQSHSYFRATVAVPWVSYRRR